MCLDFLCLLLGSVFCFAVYLMYCFFSCPFSIVGGVELDEEGTAESSRQEGHLQDRSDFR